jgi:hypothetical protein
VANQRGRNLAGQHHQGNRIHQRVGDPGNRVGCAGAGSDQHHPGLAGGAGIAFGGMGGAGLVADQDVADAVILEQRVVDRQHRAAGITEHEFDPLGDQAFDQDRGAAALLAHVAKPSISPAPSKRTGPAQGCCAGPPLQLAAIVQVRMRGGALGDRKYHVNPF